MASHRVDLYKYTSVHEYEHKTYARTDTFLHGVVYVVRANARRFAHLPQLNLLSVDLWFPVW